MVDDAGERHQQQREKDDKSVTHNSLLGFTGAKVVQIERRTKQLVVFYAECRLPSPKATVVQIERRTKQLVVFYAEMPPTFASF